MGLPDFLDLFFSLNPFFLFLSLNSIVGSCVTPAMRYVCVLSEMEAGLRSCSHAHKRILHTKITKNSQKLTFVVLSRTLRIVYRLRSCKRNFLKVISMAKRRGKECPATPPTPTLEYYGMEQNGEINFVASGNSERAKYAIVRRFSISFSFSSCVFFRYHIRGT
jgi:hypothetical protein